MRQHCFPKRKIKGREREKGQTQTDRRADSIASDRMHVTSAVTPSRSPSIARASPGAPSCAMRRGRSAFRRRAHEMIGRLVMFNRPGNLIVRARKSQMRDIKNERRRSVGFSCCRPVESRFGFRIPWHVFTVYFIVIILLLPLHRLFFRYPSPTLLSPDQNTDALITDVPQATPYVSNTTRIFNCFLYHNEAYMLYLHLLTLADYVDRFILGYANVSFTNNNHTSLSLDPFEPEIMAFKSHIVFLFINLQHLPLAKSRYRNETQWKREATARNYLLEGVKSQAPNPHDLILLCDVDEIVTRSAIALVRQSPPDHYYNLCGELYHYSYRWRVGKWLRPMVIRYGALDGPLDDYKFLPFLCSLPGVLHYHCSFCFPRIADNITKLKSFSHTEYSGPMFVNPNYIFARITCGYGVLPPRWQMPERLRSRALNPDIYLPDDPRLAFLSAKIGFEDLADYDFSQEEIFGFMPEACAKRMAGKKIEIKKVL